MHRTNCEIAIFQPALKVISIVVKTAELFLPLYSKLSMLRLKNLVMYRLHTCAGRGR